MGGAHGRYVARHPQWEKSCWPNQERRECAGADRGSSQRPAAGGRRPRLSGCRGEGRRHDLSSSLCGGGLLEGVACGKTRGDWGFSGREREAESNMVGEAKNILGRDWLDRRTPQLRERRRVRVAYTLPKTRPAAKKRGGRLSWVNGSLFRVLVDHRSSRRIENQLPRAGGIVEIEQTIQPTGDRIR